MMWAREEILCIESVSFEAMVGRATGPMVLAPWTGEGTGRVVETDGQPLFSRCPSAPLCVHPQLSTFTRAFELLRCLLKHRCGGRPASIAIGSILSGDCRLANSCEGDAGDWGINNHRRTTEERFGVPVRLPDNSAAQLFIEINRSRFVNKKPYPRTVSRNNFEKLYQTGFPPPKEKGERRTRA
jgi:hypothetical protein